MKRLLIRIATFLGGLYFFLEFVLPDSIQVAGYAPFKLSDYNQHMTLGLIAMGSMALGLGIINLLIGHGNRLLFVKKGWVNSLSLLMGLALMVIFSGLDWRDAYRADAAAKPLLMLREFSQRIASDEQKTTVKAVGAPDIERRNQLLVDSLTKELQVPLGIELNSAELQKVHTQYQELSVQAQNLLPQVLSETGPNFPVHAVLASKLSELAALRVEFFTLAASKTWHKGFHEFLFQGLFVSLGSAMFSLLGFYIASAAYRAFRIRSPESGLMMLAALLVILGQVPFMLYGQGEYGTAIYVAIQRTRLWLLSVPSAAAFRAIELGTAVAALIMSFRMWLSLDADSYGER